MSSRDLCPRRVHVSINGAASELYLEISRPALEWGWCASAWVLEGLPFELRACGLAMQAGARTPGRGAHACCVEGASGGAKTVSEEKSEGPCLRTQKSTAHSRQTDLRSPRPSVTQEFPPDARYLFYPLASRFGLEFILPRVPSSASLFPLRCDLPIRFSRRDWGPRLQQTALLQISTIRGARRGRPDASSVVSGMSAYTTPVRDGAGHMVMAPTPPTNIRNLIAQKEKVRIRLMLRTTIIQLPPEVHSADPRGVAPSNKLHRSSSRSPSSA